MNELVDNEKCFSGDVKFSYDTLTRKVTVHLQNDAIFWWHWICAGIFTRRRYFQNLYRRKRSWLRTRLPRSLRLLWYYTTTICWRHTCSPTSNNPRRRGGWTTDQQILSAPEIPTCQHKAVRKYRGQYKERHRRTCAIRVWESVAYTSFSTEQTSEFLKEWHEENSHPESQVVRRILFESRQAKMLKFTSFSGCSISAGYGLGSIFRGLFRWAVPHLIQGAKMLGKKALQTGVNVAQDVLAGENLKRQGNKTLGLTSQNSTQSGAGKKGTKRRAQRRNNSSPPGKKRKTPPQQKKPEEIFSLLK